MNTSKHLYFRVDSEEYRISIVEIFRMDEPEASSSRTYHYFGEYEDSKRVWHTWLTGRWKVLKRETFKATSRGSAYSFDNGSPLPSYIDNAIREFLRQRGELAWQHEYLQLVAHCEAI